VLFHELGAELGRQLPQTVDGLLVYTQQHRNICVDVHALVHILVHTRTSRRI